MPAGVSAYTPLANLTLSTGTAQEVNFTSISGAYRDLVCIATITSSAGTGSINQHRFNSDAGSNYSWVLMEGNGSAPGTTASSGTFFPLAITTDMTTTGRTQIIYNIMDYSATDKHKTTLIRSDLSEQRTAATVVRWASTAAITSFRIRANTTFAAGSTFALYGVSA
jgi:hypothetical protein